MAQATKIVILDDEPERIREMMRCLGDVPTAADAVTFDNAPDMIEWLREHLDEVRSICLDHDLGPNRSRRGQVFDPGTGRDVANYLATQKPVCPVLIHTTNNLAAPGMVMVLEDAGWPHARVVPYDDLAWIQEAWLEEVRTILSVDRRDHRSGFPTEETAVSATVGARRPLLILDLDETLIHSTERELDRPSDFRVGPFHVYKRPGLEHFLLGVAQHFTLAVWSSASADYVAGIAGQIAPAGVAWAFVWSRERCVVRQDWERFETNYIKDLKKVKRMGFDLSQVLIVDDTRHKLSRNYGNAIYIAPFEGDLTDAELRHLQSYLCSLVGLHDFRTIEKRGWRNRMTGPEVL